MQEMQVPFLGWEDPLEKKTANPLQYFTWKFPWTEEPGGLQLKRSQKSWAGLATEQQQQIWTSQKNRLHTVIVI